MSGSFSVENLLSQAAQGAVQPVPAGAPSATLPGDNEPTVTEQKPAQSGFDVEGLLHQASQGKMQYTPPPASNMWGGLGTQLRVGLERGVTGIANALIPPNPFSLNAGPAPPIGGLQVPEIEPNAPAPKNLAERLARRVGEFLPGAALGGGGVVRQGLMTLGGAAGSQLAEDAAPDSLKPLAATAGGIIGGGLAGEAGNFAGRVAGAASDQVGQMGLSRPKILGGEGQQTIGGVKASPTQVQMAGKQVAGALGEEGVQNLQNAPEVIVPGSQPTTAQVAMTPGAAMLEKAHRTATPDPFLARQAEQNSARLGQVQGLAPANAQPGAVGQFFQQQLDALDQQGQQAVQQARTGVQQSTEALGGTQPTGAYGDQARAALQTAKDPVHAQTQDLWRAVDPDGTWALPAGQARDTAGQLIKEVSPTAQTDAQESALLQRAAQMPDVVKFGDLGDMRADTNAALRRLSGTPGYEPNVRRLTLLKQSIDNSISDALDGRVAQEAQAVAAGQMPASKTLQQQVQDWYASRNAAAGSNAQGGGTSASANPQGGFAATPGVSGAAGQAGGRSGNIAGAPNLPGQSQPLEPNLAPEHAAAYRAAVNATREEKQTFGQGGVGQVLRPGKNGEEFAVQSGAVPRKIFTGGPTEPQEVRRFIDAVGGPDKAADIGRETLTNELRQSGIIGQDGTLDPNKFARWQAKRQATIQQFPGLGDQFANAETAQRMLDNVTATHKAALDDFQKSAAAKFINNDPAKAVQQAFSSDNPAATFTQLVRQVRGNADAEAGLKRAVVDYITEKTRSATPANSAEDFQKAATFRTFIRQNNGALKALFGGQGVQNLDMVAADLRRQATLNQQAITGSQTTPNALNVGKHIGLKEGGFHGTALAVIGEQIGEMLAHATGHEGILGAAVGAGLGGGGFLIHALRQSGIATINDLVREAMLHPQLARELVAKTAQGKITPTLAHRIARAIQTTVLAQPAQQEKQ